MTSQKMHDDEVEIDDNLVRLLLTKQFPQWSHLTLRHIRSAGTDNAIFRLGDELCVRMPRINSATTCIDKQHIWLPKIASFLSLPIPVPIAMGAPDDSYPWQWSICRWINGNDATKEKLNNEVNGAQILAGFLQSLHRCTVIDGPTSRRSGGLFGQEDEVRHALGAMPIPLDMRVISDIWDKCLRAQPWQKNPVWTHGDLLPTNLLITQGQLSAVIDFDLMGVGDPACDLICAFALFSQSARNAFRKALAFDEDTWLRGRGWALSIGLTIIPYYHVTNPQLTTIAKTMINEVIGDTHS